MERLHRDFASHLCYAMMLEIRRAIVCKVSVDSEPLQLADQDRKAVHHWCLCRIGAPPAQMTRVNIFEAVTSSGLGSKFAGMSKNIVYST